jgi:hypothetical protein
MQLVLKIRRPRYKLEDNVIQKFKETGCDGVDWIKLAHDEFQWQAFVNMVMNFWNSIS